MIFLSTSLGMVHEYTSVGVHLCCTPVLLVLVYTCVDDGVHLSCWCWCTPLLQVLVYTSVGLYMYACVDISEPMYSCVHVLMYTPAIWLFMSLHNNSHVGN